MQDRSQDTRTLLDKITASPEFAASPRLAQLLEYLVTESLEGRGDRLKGFTIGVDVFDKADDFDPSKDSLVRVQMARLRSLLDDYYVGSGKDDEERIILEKGNYEPHLGPVDGGEGEPEAESDVVADEAGSDTDEAKGRALVTIPQPEVEAVSTQRQIGRYAIVLTILAALAIGLLPFWRDRQDAIEVAMERPDGPTIYVEPYAITGDNDVVESLRDGLQFDLIAFLSQLPSMGVIGYDTAASEAKDAPKKLAKADFVLSGSIAATGDQFRITSSLVRVRDDVVIWSSSTDPLKFEPESLIETQSQIALAVASELGQPYGVIHETMRNDLENHRGISMADYLCELHAFEYMRAKTREGHDEVRKCLESAVKRRPNYSHAWALLSWIYGDDARYLFDPKRTPTANRRAVMAGEKAVQANATSAMAYQYLAIAKFYAGNDAAALDAIERAIRMSPNNSEILADASWLASSINDDPRAIGLAEKAMDLNPGHPPWYWLGPLLSSLQAGDNEAALRYARLNSADRGPQSELLLAAAMRAAGQEEQAVSMLRRDAESFPKIWSQREQLIELLRLPTPVEQEVRAVILASETK